MTSLCFVGPLLLAYEFGVAWLAREGETVERAGIDVWIRSSLSSAGLIDPWLTPLLLVLILLGWQAADPRGWRFPSPYLAGMAAESLIYAVALIGLSRFVDLLLARLDPPIAIAVGSSDPARFLKYLGAGLYEEAVFRLAMIPVVFASLRKLQASPVAAGTAAVTCSALLFSMAHHAGAPGESFTWFAFLFRWVAGVGFAWVFLARGFGIVVGTHAAYDLMVGWLGWHF